MDTTTLADRLNITEEAAEALTYMDGNGLMEVLRTFFKGEEENYRILDFQVTACHYSEEHDKEISTAETRRREDHLAKNQHPEAAHTFAWDEHPEGYDGPCICSLCRSYATSSPA